MRKMKMGRFNSNKNEYNKTIDRIKEIYYNASKIKY